MDYDDDFNVNIQNNVDAQDKVRKEYEREQFQQNLLETGRQQILEEQQRSLREDGFQDTLFGESPQSHEPRETEQTLTDDIFTGVVRGAARGVSQSAQGFVDIAEGLGFDVGQAGGQATAARVSDSIVQALESSPFYRLNDLGELAGDDGSLSDRIKGPAPEGVVGGLAEGASEFGVAFVGIGKLAKGFKVGQSFMANHKVIAAGMRGAAADGLAIDPHAPRLTDQLHEWGVAPDVVNELLGSDIDDSALEGRFKNMIEGAVIGEAVGTVAPYLFRKIMSYRKQRAYFDSSYNADKASPTDLLVPAQDTVTHVVAARGYLDDLVTMKEYVERFSEGAPGMQKLDEYATLAGKPLDEADVDGAARQLELDELRAGLDEGTEGTLQALEAQLGDFDGNLKNAFDTRLGQVRGQSPMSTLEQYDPVTAQRLSGAMKAQNPMGGDETLDDVIDAANDALEKAETEFRELRLGDNWDKLARHDRDGLWELAEGSRESKSAGARTLGKTDQSMSILRKELEARGVDADIQNIKNVHTDELASGGQSNPASVRKFLGSSKTVSFSKEQYGELKGAIARGATPEVLAGKLFDNNNINGFVDSTDADFINTYNELVGLIDRKSTKKSFAKTEAESRKLLADSKVSPENFEKFFGGSGGSLDSKILALRTLEAGLTKQVDTLLRTADTNLADQTRLIQAANMLQGVYNFRRGKTTEVARALNAHKIKVSPGGMTSREVADIATQTVGNPKKLIAKLNMARNHDNMNPEALDALLKDNTKGFGHSVYSFYINNLLSNPTTQVINNVSNAGVTAYVPSVNLMSAKLRGDAVAAAGYRRQLRKLKTNFKGAGRAAAKAFKDGQGFTTGNNVPGVSNSSPLAYAKNSYKEKGWDTAHTIASGLDVVLNLPSRLLVTGDEFAKNLNYTTEVDRIVWEKMTKENMAKPVAERIDERTLEAAVAKKVNEIPNWQEMSEVSDPFLRQEYKATHEAAVKYARDNTFQTEIGESGSRIGEVGYKIRERLPGGRYVIPFVNTPINLMHFTGSHIPGLNLLIKKERDAMMEAMKIARDPQTGLADLSQQSAASLAKMTIGTTAMMSIAAFAEDDWISGAAPQNAGERESWQMGGRDEYSFKVPGTNKWVRYDRISGIGPAVGAIVDLVNISGDTDEKDMTDMSLALFAGLMNSMNSQTFVKGLFDFIDVINSPSENKTETWLAMQASNFVPLSGGMGNAARQSDEYFRDAHDYSAFNQIINRMKSKIPGWSETLPMDLNVFAKPRRRPTAWGLNMVSPFAISEATDDPAVQYLAQLGPSFNMSAFRKIDDIELTPEQKNEYITLSAGNGRLEKMILRKCDRWRNGTSLTEDEQRREIESIVSQYKSHAQDTFLSKHPEIRKRMNLMRASRNAETKDEKNKAKKLLQSLTN